MKLEILCLLNPETWKRNLQRPSFFSSNFSVEKKDGIKLGPKIDISNIPNRAIT